VVLGRVEAMIAVRARARFESVSRGTMETDGRF
jgi:hypothetical protein